MDSGLKDKVVLITGASGGLGSEMVRQFVLEGAKVVIHYCRQQAVAETLAADLPPAQTLVLGADLTRESDVTRLWQAIEAHWKPLEIVVANAGIWIPDDVPLHCMTLDQWNATFVADSTAVFLCMREFFRGIQRHGIAAPSAVLIGSTAAVFGESGHADYAAAKGGMVSGFLLSLKNEIVRLASRGRVNAVCPGWTVTPMTAQFQTQPDIVGRALQTIPLRKVAQPSDIAAATVFLASDKLAGHITGQVIMADGGMEGRVLYERSEINMEAATSKPSI